jgi:flagellar biosynthesis GTPase FlhF
MNSKTVLNKILSLLSKDEVILTYAKLADGTIVESATFDVGEDLFVVSEDGSKTPAPDGMHELALKDSEGNETLIKVKSEAGKIVERENVELAAADEETVKVEDLPQSGEITKADEKPDLKNQVESGTLKMAEETEEVETIPQDDEAPMKEDDEEKTIEIELKKMMEKMAYRIEEMEKKVMKMEEAMMPPVDEEVTEEVAMAAEPDEEEELPKLDGAPIEEAVKFSAQKNNKNYGKKVANTQSSFLSKLYR